MRNDSYESGSTATAARPRPQDKSSSRPSEMDQQEMMRKMEEAGKPGPAHQALNGLVGNWKAEVKCWQEAGGQAETSQGTAKCKWVLGGRFLEEEFQGTMMGKPFTGKTLMGFDNTKQTFNTVWVSDMQTSMFCSEGKGESGNKVITLEGKATCAATGQKDIPMKSVYRFHSPDKHVFEMFDGSKGQNAKMMEITYTRQ